MLLSGGVDSSVALSRLIEAGHRITAFYLKIWLEDETSYLGQCPWEEDLRYARETADRFGVPLKIVPFQKEYYNRVVNYTIEAVKNGLTPNPDIMCNTQIKFGAFVDKCGGDFDAVSSGHYARTEIDEKGLTHLFRSPDPIKDQTYFLAMLHQEQLAKAMFPIGDMTKERVRNRARELALPAAERKDSQGICFLGKISFRDFLIHHLGVKEGKVIEKSSGRQIGRHRGAYLYTIGQRKGLDLPGGPWYVCAKDIKRNIVYVSHAFASEAVGRRDFIVGGLNWIAAPPARSELKVKLRHGPEMYDCRVAPIGQRLKVRLNRPDRSVTPGQFAVFYDDKECLGGGVIEDEI